MSAYSFRQIDTAVRELDTATIETLLRSQDPLEHLAALVQSTPGVRPFLLTVRYTPLFPMRWRNALALFLCALDAVGANPEFKAGKDL